MGIVTSRRLRGYRLFLDKNGRNHGAGGHDHGEPEGDMDGFVIRSPYHSSCNRVELVKVAEGLSDPPNYLPNGIILVSESAGMWNLPHQRRVLKVYVEGRSAMSFALGSPQPISRPQIQGSGRGMKLRLC